MSRIESLVRALMPVMIARHIDMPLNEAMQLYEHRTAIPVDFRAYQRQLAGFVNHMLTTCVTHGGSLSEAEAYGRGKEIIEHDYQRRGGDIVAAFNDAHDGTNSGFLNQQIVIKDRLRYEMVGRYVQWVFDQYVTPSSWEEKVAIMREFLSFYGPKLGGDIDCDDPERYARNYQDLAQAIAESIDRTASVARRL